MCTIHPWINYSRRYAWKSSVKNPTGNLWTDYISLTLHNIWSKLKESSLDLKIKWSKHLKITQGNFFAPMEVKNGMHDRVWTIHTCVWRYFWKIRRIAKCIWLILHISFQRKQREKKGFWEPKRRLAIIKGKVSRRFHLLVFCIMVIVLKYWKFMWMDSYWWSGELY